MHDFQEVIGEQFFVIDSNHLENIKSKLYGYTIQNGKVCEDDNINHESKESYFGTYIHIMKNWWWNKFESRYEWFFWIIYLRKFRFKRLFCDFKFLFKIINVSKEKISLNLNYDYASAFLTTNMCSFSYTETMAQEIIDISDDNIMILKQKWVFRFSRNRCYNSE